VTPGRGPPSRERSTWPALRLRLRLDPMHLDASLGHAGFARGFRGLRTRVGRVPSACSGVSESL